MKQFANKHSVYTKCRKYDHSKRRLLQNDTIQMFTKVRNDHQLGKVIEENTGTQKHIE